MVQAHNCHALYHPRDRDLYCDMNKGSIHDLDTPMKFEYFTLLWSKEFNRKTEKHDGYLTESFISLTSVACMYYRYLSFCLALCIINKYSTQAIPRTQSYMNTKYKEHKAT